MTEGLVLELGGPRHRPQMGELGAAGGIAGLAPANASARWRADAATITLGSPRGTVPTLCSAAAPSSPWSLTHATRISEIRCSAISR
jgi:hypothetical protein